MLNTVASYQYDPIGYVDLDVQDGSTWQELERRVQRSKTLDGGAVVADGGFSDGDRSIELTWANTSQAVHESVARLVQLYTRLVVATRDGVFLVAPERYSPSADTCTLRLLALEKLSA